MQSLLQENLSRLLEKVKLDLKNWKTINLSLAGKVNFIQMNMLPIFHLFQCIPLYLPKSIFKAIISFTWDGKSPRILLELLDKT